jgi:hypothetical protein
MAIDPRGAEALRARLDARLAALDADPLLSLVGSINAVALTELQAGPVHAPSLRGSGACAEATCRMRLVCSVVRVRKQRAACG